MTREFTVRYNPRIYIDIQRAVDFYTEQTQNSDLGERFIDNVEKALKSLSKTALHYQVRYDDIRLLAIPSFPFRAHYRVDEETSTVFVEAIFHNMQNPEEWQRTKR